MMFFYISLKIRDTLRGRSGSECDLCVTSKFLSEPLWLWWRLLSTLPGPAFGTVFSDVPSVPNQWPCTIQQPQMALWLPPLEPCFLGNLSPDSLFPTLKAHLLPCLLTSVQGCKLWFLSLNLGSLNLWEQNHLLGEFSQATQMSLWELIWKQ